LATRYLNLEDLKEHKKEWMRLAAPAGTLSRLLAHFQLAELDKHNSRGASGLGGGIDSHFAAGNRFLKRGRGRKESRAEADQEPSEW
jgi:hypothetical protein